MLPVYFDGGIKNQLAAIVDGRTNYVKISKTKKTKRFYEWYALNMALNYTENMMRFFYDSDIELIGDSNEVIRWLHEEKPKHDNIKIKRLCLKKLEKLRKSHRVIGRWVKRRENLAGRVLEYYAKRSSKPRRFTAEWYSCPRCVYKSLAKKELNEHYYNNHIIIG